PPPPAAARASTSAACMPARSSTATGRARPFPPSPPPPSAWPALRTRRLGSRRRDAFERQACAVFCPVHPHAITLGELAFEHRERQRVLQQPLDGALERPGAVHRVVALRHEQMLRRRRHLQGELALRYEPLEPLDLQIYHASDVLVRGRAEDEHVVHAIQELGLERLAQPLQHWGLHLLPFRPAPLDDLLRAQ